MLTSGRPPVGLGRLLAALCLALGQLAAECLARDGDQILSVRMPDIRPDHAEQYLCMARRVRRTAEGQFIVGFQPRGDARRVHHMLMYGCEQPGLFQRDSPNFVWDCGEMHGGRAGSSFERAPVCQEGHQQILYGWALDAPALRLPDGVGFEIGDPGSGVEFLVLQVHYGHYEAFASLPGLTDNSGLELAVRPNRADSGISKRAGVLLLLSTGFVPEGQSKHKVWCTIEDDVVIHPFRFRVHTHQLGTRVKGVKIGARRGPADGQPAGYELDESSVIGEMSPQEPQMFYPVRDARMSLARGDQVYAFCEYNNNRGAPVKIGMMGEDEMCNFYMMYWTNSTRTLTKSQCSSYNPAGSPFYPLMGALL